MELTMVRAQEYLGAGKITKPKALGTRMTSLSYLSFSTARL